jgi:ABC-type Fe3+-siderophore transport system permease subunit
MAYIYVIPWNAIASNILSVYILYKVSFTSQKRKKKKTQVYLSGIIIG